MKKLLAVLVALAMLLPTIPMCALAEMEMDVEESTLEDFGEDELDNGDEDDAGKETEESDEDDGLYSDEELEAMDEDDLSAMENDGSAFEYDFGGESYTGTWVDIPKQNMQFCLPEGWKAGKADGALYSAAKGDGKASLTLYLKDKDVDDLAVWAEDNFKPGTNAEEQTVGFYSALVLHGDNNRLEIYINTDSGMVLQFVFDRKNKDALEESFALNIVSSLYEDWFDDDDLMEEMEAEAAQ